MVPSIGHHHGFGLPASKFVPTSSSPVYCTYIMSPLGAKCLNNVSTMLLLGPHDRPVHNN